MIDESLVEVSVSMLTQHRRVAPYGMAGGAPGAVGRQCLVRGDGTVVNLDSIDFVIDANRRNYKVYSEEFEKLPGISLLDFDKFERQNFQSDSLQEDPFQDGDEVTGRNQISC